VRIVKEGRCRGKTEAGPRKEKGSDLGERPTMPHGIPIASESDSKGIVRSSFLEIAMA